MWKKRYVSNDHVLIACGVTLGLVLGFILGAIIGFSKEKSLSSLFMGSKPEDWRLQWETLLGGLLAIAAAVFTVLVMRWQTYHLIERKEMATKAMLPLSLASLMEYSEQCLKYLRTLKGFESNNTFDANKINWMATNIECPEFPDKDLYNLKEYVEYSDHTNAIILSKYMATLQVHRSRISGIQQSVDLRGEGNHNLMGSIRSSMIDSAEIYRFSEKILEFSRGCTKFISTITPNEIITYLWWRIRSDYESDSELKRRASGWTPLMDDSD